MTQEHGLWVPLAPCMVMLVKADLTLSNLAWDSLSSSPLSYQTEKNLSPLVMRLSLPSQLSFLPLSQAWSYGEGKEAGLER